MKNYNVILDTIDDNEIIKLETETSPLCIGMKEVGQSLTFHCVTVELGFEGTSEDIGTIRTMDFGSGLSVIEFIETMFHGNILIDTDDPLMQVDENVLEQFKLTPTGQVNFQYLTRLLTRVIQSRIDAVSETLNITRVKFKKI